MFSFFQLNFLINIYEVFYDVISEGLNLNDLKILISLNCNILCDFL